jgi:hypothetical protein
LSRKKRLDDLSLYGKTAAYKPKTSTKTCRENASERGELSPLFPTGRHVGPARQAQEEGYRRIVPFSVRSKPRANVPMQMREA